MGIYDTIYSYFGSKSKENNILFQRFKDCLETKKYNDSVANSVKCADNIVIMGFNDGVASLWHLCSTFGKSPTHVLSDSLNSGALGDDQLPRVRIEDLSGLVGETCVLIQWDGLLATHYARKILDNGFNNIYIYWLLSPEKEAENRALIKANLPSIRRVIDLLEDEESKRTYLSVLLFYVSGDLMGIHMSQYDQYRHPLVNSDGDNVVIDGGAFDGQSSIFFAEKISSNGKVYAFEPVEANFRSMEEVFKSNPYGHKCNALNLGLGKSARILHVSGDGAQATLTDAAPNTDSADSVKIIDIDSFVHQRKEKLDLVKLDVEGFELECLQGARKTISMQMPKLQICLYHKLTDFWEIPLYIHSLSNKYHFFVGHHYVLYSEEQMTAFFSEKQIQSFYENVNSKIIHHIETVLYAKPSEREKY